jgi:hypothetical protein
VNDEERHPMDWYPGEPMPPAVRAFLSESHVVKLQGAPGNVGSVPRANTTNRLKEIVMSFQRTTRRRRATAWPRVYFFLCLDCRLVKIGYSHDYLRRRVQLEHSTEHVLDILGTQLGGRAEEAQAHALFAADRVEGEWFRDSFALRAYLREHAMPPRTEFPPLSMDGRRGVYRKVRP